MCGNLKIRSTILFAILGLVVSPDAWAQASVVAADQAEARQRMSGDVLGAGVSANSIASTTVFALPGAADPDIGEQILLQPQQAHQAFTLSGFTNVYWTSNAQLLNDQAGSDTFLTTGAAFEYLPYLGSNFFADFGVSQSIFRYARNPNLDFNALDVTAGLIYVVRALDDVTLFSNYSYELLTQRGFNKELYHAHIWTTGVRKSFVINRTHMFFVSTEAAFTLGGWPSFAISNDFVGLVGYQASLSRALRFDLYYRAMAQDYRFVSRADFNQLIGGGLTFEVNRWVSIQALSSIGINNSTESFFNYFAANLGGGLAVSVNF